MQLSVRKNNNNKNNHVFGTSTHSVLHPTGGTFPNYTENSHMVFKNRTHVIFQAPRENLTNKSKISTEAAIWPPFPAPSWLSHQPQSNPDASSSSYCVRQSRQDHVTSSWPFPSLTPASNEAAVKSCTASEKFRWFLEAWKGRFIGSGEFPPNHFIFILFLFLSSLSVPSNRNNFLLVANKSSM